ncbi:hypothetical protein Dimus_022425 [Dionaea muscipula]
MAEDSVNFGKFGKLGCRRSSRLSSTSPATYSDLSKLKVSGFPLVAESESLEGELAEKEGGEVSLLRDLASLVRDFTSSDEPVSGSTSMKVQASSHGGAAPLSVMPGLVVDSLMEGGQQVLVDVGPALRLSSSDGRQQRPSLPVVSSCRVAGVGHGGRGVSMESGQMVSPCVGSQHGSNGDIRLGGGIASGGTGRSYASAVGPDKRSDVRLHFVSSVIPADGEELCMMNSDGDQKEWEVFLVDHFLQSRVPFSVVRPRLLHLWIAKGSVEVRSPRWVSFYSIL